MLTLDYLQDPGHGWIAADIAHLRRFGLLDKISEYSYRQGDLCWLEEDCDAGLYIDALRGAGIEFKVVETHTNRDSFIRNLPRFYA